MNKQKDLYKMTSVVHSGWMTKSPPERKLRSHFKIFRSQWKKRYFVLRKPEGSLPDQYELLYYKDERCSSKKGSIDLEQCEQIIESLDSDVFPYLLAIKTSYKHKVRTYYLATDTEQDMSTWVQWLCHVCGLRPEDQPTDIPDPKPDNSPQTVLPENKHSVKPVFANGVSATSQPAQREVTSLSVSTLPKKLSGQKGGLHSVASADSDPNLTYFSPGLLLSTDLQTNVEDTQDSVAPPLPQKRNPDHRHGMPPLDDEVFTLNVYDHPPAPRLAEGYSNRISSGVYNSPPTVVRQEKYSADDVPRTLTADTRSRGPSLSKSSDTPAESGTSDRASAQTVISNASYDNPRGSSTSSECETPPVRPPKPHFQSPYQNLPPSGRIISGTDLNTVVAAPKSHHSQLVPGYDVPRSSHHRSSHQTEFLHVPGGPGKPSHHSPTNFSSHIYLNTINRPGSDGHSVSSSGSSIDQSSGHSETENTPPAVPPSRTGLTGDTVDGLYQHPPASLSARSPRSVFQSHRLHNGTAAASQGQDEGKAVIFSTKRTRSFKSPNVLKSTVVKQSPKTSSISLSATIPAPRPMMLARSKDMSTSDEDEQHGHDQQEETHHPLSLLRSIPAPPSEADRELKYIDLAMPESSGQETTRSSHPPGLGHSHSHIDRCKETPTEYREIDFVKTQALSDTKRERTHEDKKDQT